MSNIELFYDVLISTYILNVPISNKCPPPHPPPPCKKFFLSKSHFSHIGVCYPPEDKVDVEQELPAEGVAPAAQEKGADDREQMIHNALVYLSTIIHQKNSGNKSLLA